MTLFFFLTYILVCFFMLCKHVALIPLASENVTNAFNFLNQPISYCQTAECLQYVKMLQENMDLTIDPCESFYDFNCGKFIKNVKLTDSIKKLDVMDKLYYKLLAENSSNKILRTPPRDDDIIPIKNAKFFYSSCIHARMNDENSEKYFINLLEDFGGWPILKFNQPNRLKTVELLKRIHEYENDILFSFGTEQDPYNSTKKILRINQPILTEKKYFNHELAEKFRYFISQMMNYMRSTNFNHHKDISDLFELKKAFSMIQINNADRRDDVFEKITIKKLGEHLPQVPWFEIIANGILKNVASVDENEEILIRDWNYFVKFADIYANYSTNFKNNAINYMPLKYHVIKLFYTSVFNGLNKLYQKREELCSRSTSDLMPLVVGRLYVQKFFNESSRKKIAELSDFIMNEFKNILDKQEWFDEKSKKLAFQKVNLMKFNVGYPDKIFKNSFLESVYDFEVSPHTYLENGLKIIKNLIKRDIETLRKPFDLDENFFPTIVNAFYMFSSNQILLPAPILQMPFYNSNLPNYLNFGAIGLVIAHEITHGFDNYGRYFDQNGNLLTNHSTSNWSPRTIENYENRTKCLIDQFDSYYVEEAKLNVNGSLTLGENIADNGGLKISYKAYEKYLAKHGEEPLLPGILFNQKQLFFINLAQTWCSKSTPEYKIDEIKTDLHSPAPIRILGITSNSEAFVEAFNCKPKQKNFREKRCSIW